MKKFLVSLNVREPNVRKPNFMKFLVLGLVMGLMGAANQALADSPKFNNLSSDDFNSIMKDFSALSSYSSVSGASGRGSLLGFEVGLIGSVTSTPNVDAVAKKADSSLSIPQLPSAGVLAAISIPMGLSFELMFLPQTTVNNLNYQQFGGAVQYKILSLPIDLSVKAHYTKTQFNYSQVVNNYSTAFTNVNTTINFDDTLIGGDLMVGKDLVFLEPYVGVGYESAKANLGVTGSSTATIFAPSYTSAQSASASPSSSRFLVGVEFKLLLIRLGAEYLRAYDTNRYNAKLSVGF
jgi:hypothetical protein